MLMMKRYLDSEASAWALGFENLSLPRGCLKHKGDEALEASCCSFRRHSLAVFRYSQAAR